MKHLFIAAALFAASFSQAQEINYDSLLQANTQKLMSFIDQKLPPFELKDMDGNLVKSSSLAGRPIVINFWFAKCMPCIREMPELNKIKKTYGKDIVFLSMTYEPRDTVTAFLKKHPFDFTNIPDARSYCELFTTSYPVSLFVDRNGIIKAALYGMPFDSPGENDTMETAPIDPTEFLETLKKIYPAARDSRASAR